MQWNEMRELLSNCYFATGHCPWLRCRTLSEADRLIYHSSKEYKELQKLNARWGQLSANHNLFYELVGGMDFKQANTVFWDDASVYASAQTISLVSQLIETLRLDTEKFREDRRAGRRLVFKKIKEITGNMSYKAGR